jgi:putative hemolysin
MNPSLESVRRPSGPPLGYVTRLARGPDEVRAAQTLRFAVFNLELGEGLEGSHRTGLDEDPFDAVCDHLVVEHRPTGQVVGTYRMQTGERAAANLGFYCAQEFELGPFDRLPGRVVELGRACVHRAHRNPVVLASLWKGVGDYAVRHGARHLLGCSSLTSQDPAVGASAYAELSRDHLVEPRWRTRPRPAYVCPTDRLSGEPVGIPRLLRTYLALGARICGPPALDRDFGTIDFLTLLDLEDLPPVARRRFLDRDL